jgi:acyl-CoA reductase LuxC
MSGVPPESPFEAFYLPPGLGAGLETTVQRFGPAHASVELKLPCATPADLARWIPVLLEARRQKLLTRSTDSVLRSLDRVARRFLDPRDPARRSALAWLERAGSYSRPVIERALEDAFEPLLGGGLKRWVEWELGSTSTLDAPQSRRRGHAVRAHGPEWMLHVYAGNVPGLPVWPMFGALILRSALLAKTSSREPVLAPLLARTIAESDADLGACLAVLWWKGGSGELDRAALGMAPAVLAFGGDAAIASVAREARSDARVVLHGPKVSVAYVAREALTPGSLRRVALRAAHDVVLYDQEGCLSPHAIYVERGDAVPPARFAAALGAALDELRAAFPGREPDDAQAARIQLYRAQAAFDAGAGVRGTRLLGSREEPAWTVVFEEGARFEPGPAHRTVRVHEVSGIDEVLEAIRPAIRTLEAIALEARGRRRSGLIAAIASAGVPRVAALGSLQRPSPLGAHGGVPRLLPFVSWTTVDREIASGTTPRAPARAAPGARKAPASRPSGPRSPRSRRARSGSR